ncbi:MAG: Methyltransferase type 11 [Paenibacillus sp.]|jgi:trans-aconitate methyltransferase|nr:Methyltransferase type 11 [Paenibacillus sp.]
MKEQAHTHHQPTHQWDAALYDNRIGFVSEYGKSVVELLGAMPGESVLDIGCGTGDLCHHLAEHGVTVHGIDSSAEMIVRARDKYAALSFEVADAQHYRTDRRYDAVFSNAALHWMKRPADVIASVKAALRPGGRFVAEFGGKHNVQGVVSALYEALGVIGVDAADRNPWYFPSMGEYAALLEDAGFRVEYALHFSRPTPLDDGERGVEHWLAMFAANFFTGLSDADKRQVIAEVKRLAAPALFRDGQWVADYWRLRIRAYAPVE